MIKGVPCGTPFRFLSSVPHSARLLLYGTAEGARRHTGCGTRAVASARSYIHLSYQIGTTVVYLQRICVLAHWVQNDNPMDRNGCGEGAIPLMSIWKQFVYSLVIAVISVAPVAAGTKDATDAKTPATNTDVQAVRSEERRVGKECRSRW